MATTSAPEQLLHLVVLPRIQKDKWSLYWKVRPLVAPSSAASQ